MKFKNYTRLLALVLILLPLISHAVIQNDPQEDETQRRVIITAALASNQNLAAVALPGMTCSSCGTGAASALRKLKEVDQTRFNRGIELHAEGQFALVALKPKTTLDQQAVAKAIWDSGFDTSHLYYWDGEKLIVQTLPKFEG